MKQCPNCNTTFPSLEAICHACGIPPEMIDGFPAFAPSLAHDGSGFNSSHFSDLASYEGKNFWFRARNRLIVWALGHYCPTFHAFLEIGCGTGYVLAGIAKAYPYAHIQGSELLTKGLSFAANRLPQVKLMQMDARRIPFIHEFDCIGAFDVLEHIEEDTQVLHQVHKALKPQGICLLTVPQHRWLWSSVDDDAGHVRRYTKHELHLKLQASGFEILRSTSFVTSLLPVMLLSRLTPRFSKSTLQKKSGLDLPPWLNFLFETLLNCEIHFIRRGIHFLWGGSRLVVARKAAILGALHE